MSYLPFWVLYRVSDLAFLIIFYLFRYRHGVVLDNLARAFPEKSEAERRAIAKDFFRHFCDVIVESVKGCSISRNAVSERHRNTNAGILEPYYRDGRQLTILGAHYANWEWVALSLPLSTKFQTYGIYQTLTNPFMNRVIKASRERNGMKLISKEEVAPTLEATKGQPITMGYIGDQSPSRHGRKYWLQFLGQDTAAMSGFEHYAKTYDTPVLYLSIKKVRRGHYEGTLIPLFDKPRETKDGEIVETFMSRLEEVIRAEPRYWLWSHRRWKIRREDSNR